MDEVLEKLETTLISREPDENKTNFDGLYKNWGKLGNQEQRRRELLDVQKSDRNNKLDRFRGIIELVNTNEDNNIFKYKNYRPHYRPSIYVAGFTKTSHAYNNVLMMSEWMIEKPEDFYENWYVTPCPKGVRMLVVANQGRTKCYTKYGQFRNEFRTALPGGNPCEPGYKNRCCVLDCFYVEQTNTMYVADILAWNRQPMTDGETDFRHYWMLSNLGEIAELKTINKRNKVMFHILPKTLCTPESFNKFMMTHPHFENFSPALDGLLFYHKETHYVAGQTPLVGWLFPFMVPEILGNDITINPAYMLEKPTDYVNQAEFIQKFEEKHAKKAKPARKRYNSFMDTTPIKPDKKITPPSSTTSTKNKGGKPKLRTKSTQYEEMEADPKPSENAAADTSEESADVPKESEIVDNANEENQGKEEKSDQKNMEHGDNIELRVNTEHGKTMEHGENMNHEKIIEHGNTMEHGENMEHEKIIEHGNTMEHEKIMEHGKNMEHGEIMEN